MFNNIILIFIWMFINILFSNHIFIQCEGNDVKTHYKSAAIVIHPNITTARTTTNAATTKAPTTKAPTTKAPTTKEPTTKTTTRATTTKSVETTRRPSTAPTRSTSLMIDPRVGLRFDDYYYGDYYQDTNYYEQAGDNYYYGNEETGGDTENYGYDYYYGGYDYGEGEKTGGDTDYGYDYYYGEGEETGADAGNYGYDYYYGEYNYGQAEETGDTGNYGYDYNYGTYGEYSYDYYTAGERKKRQATVTACGCYAPAQCNNSGNTDGTGLIDFRIITGGSATCPSGLAYCCPGQNQGGSAVPQISCGSRITSYVNYPILTGQARYGDYPWMALIQTSGNDYVGGGVLIDYQYILTAAHKLTAYSGNTGLKVRLGEWDTSANYEQYPYREYNISHIWIHESFNPSNLKNDIALIRLGAVVATYPAVGIVPICMPSASQNFEGQRCWVAGWGKDQFGAAGRFQTILRATDVPVITSTACQNSLRSTRLGSAFLLDKSSFICAGGEENKDACTGDGGSGLVCEVSSGRWTLAGLVAWGIGCASQNVPAAYVNVPNYIDWIKTKQST